VSPALANPIELIKSAKIVPVEKFFMFLIPYLLLLLNLIAFSHYQLLPLVDHFLFGGF